MLTYRYYRNVYSMKEKVALDIKMEFPMKVVITEKARQRDIMEEQKDKATSEGAEDEISKNNGTNSSEERMPEASGDRGSEDTDRLTVQHHRNTKQQNNSVSAGNDDAGHTPEVAEPEVETNLIDTKGECDQNNELGNANRSPAESSSDSRRVRDRTANCEQSDGTETTKGNNEGHIGVSEKTQKMEVIVQKVAKGGRPLSNTSELFNPDPRTNTPASGFFSSIPEFTTTKLLASQGDGENSRDSMFQQAIHLMTERCPSMALTTYSEAGVPLVQNTNLPFGPNVPKYFYVEQKNPSPMTPLPAWRGYNGNVYFQPIKVNQAQYSVPSQPESPALDKCSDQLKGILSKSKRVQSSKSLPVVLADDPPPSPEQRNPGSAMAGSRSTPGSGKPGKRFSYKGSRQMAVLDKKTVFDRTNERLPEDIVWIVGQESTGSLRVDQAAREKRLRGSGTGHIDRTLTKHSQLNHIPAQKAKPISYGANTRAWSQAKNTREKICRGSVAHKIYAMKNKMLPFFSVSGDRYSHQPVPPSPILRTQTQYSQSNQRTINSPDLYHPGYERLPPLEQLRASLKQMETTNQGSLMHVIPPLERIKFEDTDSITKNKPLIKYSAEVKNSARRSRQMSSGKQQRVL